MSSSTTKKKQRKKIRRFDPSVAMISSDEFFNRELSWLEFNRRVLLQAQAPSIPLLERLRFLTIYTSNLDEFFMNRVGGLKQRLEASKGLNVSTNDVQLILDKIRQTVLELNKLQDEIYHSSIIPSLNQNGIHLLTWRELSAKEREFATSYFRTQVFPILTPQSVDPGHPFPAISNLSLSLGVLLKHPDREEELFARVKVPSILPQILRLEAKGAEHFRGISLSQIIRHNLPSLFPGMEVESVLPFRITRNAELDVDEEETQDLAESIAEGLRERKFAQIVRLEHTDPPAPSILRYLMEEVDISDTDVYVSSSALDFPILRELCDAPVPHLKYENWSPPPPPQLSDEEANIFSVIRSGDVIVHHPYDSFSGSVERFLKAAVEDPKVVAIKMTLYRAGDHSPLIPLLIRAAEQDKQVVVLIELKASFDEARNIKHAQMLEDAGAHVMYGVVGLKTHAKMILVARQENDSVQCYAHIGTGNYNSTTARFYTDLGIFTCDPDICDDVVELFHYLTGRSLKKDYKQLLVAPVGLREKFLSLIEREIEHHKNGRPAHIIIKANSLEETAVCRALSKAAQAGVPVDLIIRGICCLKPFRSGEGTNPRVLSVIGRFLEHSRILYFRNGQADLMDGEIFISSADPMYRNLHRRVEVAVPIRSLAAKERCWEVLTVAMHDSVLGWDLMPDGTYVQRKPDSATLSVGSHQLLMRLAKDRSRPH
jgi:polyphosphate kinase